MACTIAALEGELPSSEMNELVTEILASSLRSIGLFSNGIHRIADLPLDEHPAQYYERWLESSIRHLQEQDVLAADLTFLREVRPLADLWDEWEGKVSAWACDSHRQAQTALLKACLEGLPGVLSGNQPASDGVFPAHLIEGPRADYFNDVLGRTLSAHIEQQLQIDPQRKFRIIEIGAGTGGTTAALLPIVERYPIEEYCFTDRSKASLMHAEQQFRPRCPVLTTSMFDVSLPLEAQSVAMNHYDFAIAANALHATANIREAVRNAKAVLKNEGVLLLNEFSTWSLFNHLTVGRLVEWWQYEDAAVRRPGSPGLSPGTWQEILTAEGFESIAFPAEEAHELGQQIIAAVSNGWTRQRIVKIAPPPRVEPAYVKPPDVAETRATRTASPSPAHVEQLATDHTRQIITTMLGEALRMDAGAIQDDAPFAGYGVDSIVGVNLVRKISEALQIDLESTSLFEYSTVDELARYISTKWHDRITAHVAQLHGAQVSSRITPDRKPAEAEPGSEQVSIGVTRFTDIRIASDLVEVIESADPGTDPIAIIGMSGRFAESESLDAFWVHLAEGHDLVKQVSRWSPRECVMPGSAAEGSCSHGSFIDSIDQFDPAFFGLSELEATYMDPQQRLFLEESWKALEDAGYACASVSEKQCGVYVGCGSSKYDRLHTNVPPPHAFSGNSSAVMPARIAYRLNLQGPALAVDTACSSSLVAIHLACQGLWSREMEMALAGGVFLNATPGFYHVANRASMLSPDGKCHSFDAGANGFVPGEGVGVLVLKRLSDAMADGDSIHGVIVGSGINQDGRSNGLSAPNGRAQERLERSVYDRFKIDPATIQVVEAHATGTLLGDSVEHAALTRAFREHTDKRQFCALGTVKTNIGHTSAAAGVAGVLKLLLSLKHRQIPPSLHFEKGNPAIDFDSGPFYVNTELKSWNAGADDVRRAAISSFGFGGTNAHLVIDQAPAIVRRDDVAPAYLVVLSARSGEQLKQQVRNLLAHLERTPDLSLTDLSFTLLMGRMHFGHRLACVAHNQRELAHLLEQWAESGPAPHVYAAEIQEGNIRERVSLKKFGNHCIEILRSSPDADGYGENLTAVAELYVQGYALDYRSLFPEDARRIPLPTYPFARGRYWLEDEQEMASLPSRETGTALDLPLGSDASDAFPFGSGGGDLRGTLQNDLSRMVTEILGLSHGNVSPDKVLQDLGLDSMGLTKFAEAINCQYQLDITPVVFFDYPSIGEISKYLSEKHGSDLRRVPVAVSGESRPAAQVSTPAAAEPVTHVRAKSRPSRVGDSLDRHAVREPVAIVGLAGVMPQADDLDELWANLVSSRNAITVIPRDRWNWEDTYGDPLKEQNKSNSKWGGFMREVDKFDPRFFGISPREAQMIDPQQRIFLETAWKAIEDAGHKASELSGTNTGVFAAAGNNDYKEVLRNVQGGLDGYSAAGNTNSVLANRISFLLNLRGPSENIDTACSSVLVALNRAVDSIQTGECDMALVGGVNALVSPEPYIAFGKAGLLSTDGKCKTFDKRANGFVRAEGAGAIFVKRLSAAEADGNHIYAVILATAENHGGRVPTLGAPSASGQTALLIQAYEKAQIDPTTVGYIECHGTGTALGDPIETQALSTAFAELYKRHDKAPAELPHCGLGSIKTNVGHLENAAGIAGVVKVLLALKHKQIPANLHFEELNPYIRLERTPFYIVDKLTPWLAQTAPDGSPVPRRAGVSSFGFGGTNSHVVLEEYVPRTRADSEPAHAPELIVLSAKNEDRLKAYARSMLTYLETTAVELRDFAHTLQVGRDEMPERLAMIAASPEDARQKLGQFLEGRGKSTDLFHDNTRASTARGVEEETPVQVQALVERKELAKLGELWVSGTKIDWKLLREGASARRMSLPTYPFARERHWATGKEGSGRNAQRAHGPAAAAFLHPMVHRNVSTLEEQKFASRFSGDEFYFDDHRVETQKVLPAVGYLEIVRAAGELAGIPSVRVIRNVTWQRPLIVGGDGEEVEVLLTPDNKDVKFSVRTVGRGRPIEHCTGKLASSGGTAVPEVIDIAAIRERCPRQVLSGPELYGPFLAGSGLDLRKSFQIVQKMYANESESLAILQFPEHLRADADQFFLHPAMMDGAVHSFLGLVKRSGSEPLTLSLPFSMGEVQILHPLKDLYYGYATLAGDVRDRQDNQKLTIYLLDQRGTVLVRLKDFVLRPVPRGAAPTATRENVDRTIAITRQEEITTSLQTLIPVWNTVRLDATKRLVAPASTEIVLAGSDDAQLDWVRKSFPNARLLSPSESLADCAFDQLIWIAPDVTDASQRDWDDRLIERQEEGVLSVFRLIKTLLQSGYAGKGLKWTLITQRTQRVTVDDAIQPAHAGIAGLIGSVAKEYPRWDLRMLDVDSLASVSAQECLSLPWDKQGNALAHRSGEWSQQGLARLDTTLPEAKSLYRKNGVYVVIGGAGGVGEVWSRFMIERYQARIVWIGRRASDAGIEARINALAGLGNAPLYIPADAADLNALERAREIVLQTYGAIHGVVHSAIVLQDQSIARMDESTFSTTLSAKVDVSVNMERVFGAQKLDFMLFFSSMISFIKSAGQSNYSAGCTFKDAFAHTLQQKHSYPVKIMNWGYWGSVGIVADEEHKKRMARMGAASIEPEEGMASLQALVNSDVPQIALLKTLTSDSTALGLSETITCYAKTAPTILTEVQVTAQPIAPLEADGPAPEMVQLITEILASSLQAIGLFKNGIDQLAGLAANSAPYLERWLSSSIHYLKQQQLVGEGLTFNREIGALADLWAAWDAKKAAWTTSENRGAHIALLEACLRALPGVLTGKQLPTDVMFPKSSMRLVEPVYRGNLQADYFNGALRDTLLACIEQLLKADGNRKIRILEIGAGTGGTTAGLLPVLQQYPVEEYCYTDLSKAFLMHAERNYRPQLPALTTAIFDVSKPLASQSIRAGHYDVAIAANVLHATPNIRETLRNAKAVLNNQGVLLLNELSTWSLLTHVTFGLLEGWWLCEDVALRLPGTPGIGTDQWRAVLAEEGFEPILFTTPDAARFGQQIIAAGSNGWVRQRLVKGAAQRPAVAVKQEEPVPVAPQRTQQVSSDHIRRIIIDALSEALKLDPDTIRNDEPFADYGVDSIVGVNLVTTIGENLQIELETTKLFEYTTVDQIAEYIATQYREQLPAQPAPQPPPQVQVSSQTPVVSARSAEASERMSAEYVRGIISETVSEALQLDPATIRNDEPFADYGVDSIIGVNLVTTLSEKLRIELDTTRLFEFTTIDQLADHIQSEWRDHIAEQLPVAASAPAPVEIEFRPAHRFAIREPLLETVREIHGDESKSRDVSTDRIAIIGISGRFAESESLEEFWRNLKEGKDLVRTVSRWNTSDCIVPGSSGRYCTDGSFIDSIDRFDPAFFRISQEEAVCMDPQQRLFLEESWKALEDAGYAGKSVREKQCGVYVGCVSSRYRDLLGPDRPAYALWGTTESVIPQRIAYYLDLQGPAMAVDTACSSSLVAIHLACQALWTRETEMALAGGIFLQPTSGFYRMANHAGMLSPDGKCFSFDERANGYVPGEGVGVLVLKRLRDALADGDHIYGVIAGTGINQDGASNGLIAPNPRAQERLERSVYDRFGINPETIQLVEAHGTGTLLGDSIEYGALSRAFRAYTDKKQFCALGTMKTNFGHTVTAAGVASVLKVLLSMKHRQIPPSLHLRKANPGIAFESGPFYVNSELKEWTVGDNQPRRAAVSSFGFNGTNAHLVIEEAPAPARSVVEAPGYLLALSARTREQLQQHTANLLVRLKATPGMSMNDASFSLFVGRMHLPHRLACVVRSQEEAIQLLEQWVLTGATTGQVYASEVQEGRTREHVSLTKMGNRCIQDCRNATNVEYLENLAAIADLYVQGYSLEFQALFPENSRRVPLPTYPFARERYWVDAVTDAEPQQPAAPSAQLHPLLHTNTSTLDQQSYGCTLTGTELFLRDQHSVANGGGGLKVLSEAAYLEMARAAMEISACIPEGSSVVDLQDIVWADPMVVEGNKQMTIALFAGDDEHVSYEIYSGEGEREIIHCQGRALLGDQPAPSPLGRGQLLARVSLPSMNADGRDGGYGLHPTLMSGALQAAGDFIAARGEGAGAALVPRAMDRLRILAPCTEEVFVWRRRASENEMDIDLIDAGGNVCVQMRGLSFHADVPAAEPVDRRTWLFAKERTSTAGGIGAVEKITLFLAQDTALQLQKAMEEVPTDQSFFDLGLTSLGMAHLVQNTGRLLDEDLSPSMLFDYSDIRSLAAHLAMTYPAKIDAVKAVRQVESDPGVILPGHAAPPAALLRRRRVSGALTRTPRAADVSIEQILESVSWQEASLHDGYEKVTF